jgi:hypothetical protein
MAAALPLAAQGLAQDLRLPFVKPSVAGLRKRVDVPGESEARVRIVGLEDEARAGLGRQGEEEEHC